jgi:hypothetical protein
MGCLACGRGFCDECENGGCEACHLAENRKIQEAFFSSIPRSNHRGEGGYGGSQVKAPGDVTDRPSTGRKRAAMMYPIIPHRACDWQGKKNCGGGIPITGCISGKQVDVHHGPIKDTLENSPWNIHRLCKFCHNRWHTVNDPKYIEEEWAKTKHEPQPATEAELLDNETFWKSQPRHRRDGTES